ncbi:MAG: hypothetical protein GY936_13270 [Ignavibacteriae bacterium]|nr:hypothetical protein [Ignavibacteriota bacterium]
MLNSEDIKMEFDKSLIEISPLVIRNLRDKTDDGGVIYEPELQFQLKNISKGQLVDLNIEVNYYDLNNQFVGADTDLQLVPVLENEKVTFSMFIEFPEKVKFAELVIKTRSKNFKDSINSIISHPIVLIGLVVLLVYSNVK